MAEPDIDTFRAAIVRVFPARANAHLRLLTAGWHAIGVDVDNELICKFPRHGQAEQGLVTEAALLEIIRPRVSMPVPDMRLHKAPPLFSSHRKLQGEHLVAAQYETLSETERRRLGDAMGRFYAELHAIDRSLLIAAGARPLKPWSSSDIIRTKTLRILPPDLHAFAQETIATFESLPPDPHGTTYGFFDGHGWNMAFDHESRTLNGVYDFGDSGIGPLHQEFIYSNFISPDLTQRIVTAYEMRTGLALDSRRIETLTGMHRLWELSELGGQPEHRDLALENVAALRAMRS
jgi:aminoglycoside phosphotransferase (APT) family kinase protein